MSLSTLPAELTLHVASFLEKGADINALSQVNFEHYARLNAFLYRHNAKAKYTDRRHDRTALSWAAFYGREALVKWLIDRGECDINHCDRSFETPLHLASREGHTTIVKILLKCPDIDIRAINDYSETPFYLAAAYDREDIVNLLLETGEVDVNLENFDGNTPFIMAVSTENKSIVKRLLQEEDTDMFVENIYGGTALSLALDCVKTWEHWKAMVNLLRREARRRKPQAK
ncbi:ankyrin repeat-containing protein [Penicillium angulare]|uniref:Ankyrin repeat-containing protein n=1 Tax=Penicillium angulare TaxID=116970 RepID=A0A9W9KIL7_9EURO|nr:ankyrin repeat-containing protein [Penicillium angulare]